MESIQCEICNRSFDDTTLLTLHHQFEQCSQKNFSNEFLCPLCDGIFYDSYVLQLHINEEHDHFPKQKQTTTTNNTMVQDSLLAQDLARRERMHENYKQENSACAISYNQLQDDDDAQMARILQDQEDAETFQEFQNRYGGSTRSFADRARWNLERQFKRKFLNQNQYNEYKQNLDDIIAQPFERNESRSIGIIPILLRLPTTGNGGNIPIERRLCTPGCDHFCSTWLDQGWACGYKNFQILLSSLRHDPQYTRHLFGNENRNIPSVSHLQMLIEKAWIAGYDSAGREQLNGQLNKSTKWIGPTEIMACLAHLHIKTELFDFHKPLINDYTYLFEWIRDHFRQQENGIIHPLYLQHEGHSRTIVGYEQLRNGQIRLIIFDPSTSKYQIDQFRNSPNQKAHIFRRTLQSFQQSVYQILVVRRNLRPDEQEAAKHVRSTKVPLPR